MISYVDVEYVHRRNAYVTVFSVPFPARLLIVRSQCPVVHKPSVIETETDESQIIQTRETKAKKQ